MPYDGSGTQAYCMDIKHQEEKETMGKRQRNETEEERKERKRAKKAAKRAKREKEHSAAKRHATPPLPSSSASPAGTTTIRASPVSPTRSTHTSTDDGQSVFHQKRLKMMVSLYPVALENSLSHVRESLRSLLLKYSDGVKGVLLGFDNVEFSEENGGGRVMNELPQIHYSVELDALVFSPEIGSKVRAGCGGRMHGVKHASGSVSNSLLCSMSTSP